MNSFLEIVARKFIENSSGEIEEFCFVFPNRRSCTFFKKYLAEQVKTPLVYPEIFTISDFISSQTGLVDASRVEQIFALYDEYRKLTGEAADFEQFLYWGDMVLSDFNDVDRDLVNAEELFANVKNYKDINADYLTKEQVDVINDYFGEYRNYSSDDLWQKQDAKSRYIKLWHILYPLYCAFRESLLKRGMSYPGMSYRKASELISKKNKNDFTFKRIVFVGFSTLSKSEESIFDSFQRLSIGDFYWDFNSPVFEDEENKGTFFLKGYVKKYRSKYDLCEPKVIEMPKINIISVPSGGGQAKVAGNIVRKLVATGSIADKNNAIDTAIVLPEEKYLSSVLLSIPNEIGKLNITMGYPMRDTAIATFMSTLAVFHSRKRVLNGVMSYFYEDLETFLSHPYTKQICRDKIGLLQREMLEKRMFFVAESTIVEFLPSLSLIFRIKEQDSPDAIINYVRCVISFVENELTNRQEGILDTQDNNRISGNSKLEHYFIVQYLNTLSQISEIARVYNVKDIKAKVFFYLLDRMLAGTTVAFEGEPMSGLQIMGVLETRLLDFKNLIIMSMNERVFPSKQYSKSFIPTFLRKGYGISDYHSQDAMFTYYFYRMISRAENVYLLYDSRVQGVSSGEPSRYIYQLRQLYNRNKCNEYILSYNVTLPGEEPFIVAKTERIMNLLEKYTNPESGKYLSASAINSYINCPMLFYFKFVEGFKENDEMQDFIDSSTFGTVVHGVMQKVYDLVPVNKEGKRIVTADFLDKLLDNHSVNNKNLHGLATVVINKEYNKLGEDNNSDLAGDARIIREIVLYYVKPLLRHDKQMTPFEYVGSEVEEKFGWKLDSDLSVNFRCYIDRIDKVNGIMRIVDYKTGSDPTEIKNIDSIFEKINDSTPQMKAILQLLLYCNAYSYRENYDGPIQPVIYNIRAIHLLDGKKFEIKYNGKVVENYKEDINEGFMERIISVIKEIFNSDIAFRQTDNSKSCSYCPFLDRCKK